MRTLARSPIHKWESPFQNNKKNECYRKKEYPCDPAVPLKMEDRTSSERDEHREEKNSDLEKDPQREISPSGHRVIVSQFG